MHSASDTFHSPSGAHSYVTNANPNPYVVMLGGEFIMHGAKQIGKIITIDRAFPGMQAVGENMQLFEEWYSLKQFQPDIHVVQVIDPQNMNGTMYKRGPYPVTWIHPYAKGRVFYTAIGHLDEVWTNDVFRSILVGGIDYALGCVQVDDKPNLLQVVPTYAELPPAPLFAPPKPKKSDQK